ncbi:MAG: YihY/virulence factor BrkB family protein [Chloroflexota bacterium]|jgi:membrane protein
MQATIDIIKKTFKSWRDEKVSRLAAALAYYTVFSIPPLLVVSIGIASIFTDRQVIEDQVINQAGNLMGPQGAEAIETILQSTEAPGGNELLPTIIGIIFLLLGASAIFTQLQDAMNTIWDVEADPDRGILAAIKERFMSFTMVLAIGFILLVSLLLSTVLTTLGTYIGNLVSETEIVLGLVNFIISYIIFTVLFGVMFKTIPDVRVAWRDVWIGAAITAALFMIGEYALGIFLDRSDPTSAYGAAGSVILILLWVFFSAQVLFLGAEFTQVYATEYGSGMQPERGAVVMSEAEKIKQGIPPRDAVEQEKEVQKSSPTTRE